MTTRHRSGRRNAPKAARTLHAAILAVAFAISPGNPADATTARTTAEPTIVTIQFSPGSVELGLEAERRLRALVQGLRGDPDIRVGIEAYAAATGPGESAARRTSLYRALAVRSYMAGQGVPTGRMTVRALGSAAAGAPADRVDVVLPVR